MIDTHCHIDFEDFDDDREDVIKRAEDKLDNVIVSGFSNDSNMKVLQLSKDYEGFIFFLMISTLFLSSSLDFNSSFILSTP